MCRSLALESPLSWGVLTVRPFNQGRRDANGRPERRVIRVRHGRTPSPHPVAAGPTLDQAHLDRPESPAVNHIRSRHVRPGGGAPGRSGGPVPGLREATGLRASRPGLERSGTAARSRGNARHRAPAMARAREAGLRREARTKRRRSRGFRAPAAVFRRFPSEKRRLRRNPARDSALNNEIRADLEGTRKGDDQSRSVRRQVHGGAIRHFAK